LLLLLVVMVVVAVGEGVRGRCGWSKEGWVRPLPSWWVGWWVAGSGG
jgi:hypothetical protein